MPGAPALLEAVAGKLRRHYRYTADPASDITITPGATEALFCAIQALVHPGDEVIVFDPAYDSYEPAVTLAGGRTVHLPLSAPDFSIPWQRVADTLNERTALIIVNSPHNPTGAIIDAADLDTLAELTRDSRVKVLSDEVYEHIIFDGRAHASMLTHAELAERSMVVSSFGKSFHATGWKVGYMVAPPELSREFRKVHQYNQFCVVHPVQRALGRLYAVQSRASGTAAGFLSGEARFAVPAAPARPPAIEPGRRHLLPAGELRPDPPTRRTSLFRGA